MIKLKLIFTVILTSYMSSLCFGVASGSYIGQEPPGMTPEVFAPGIISVEHRYEYTISFSPDGKECCFGVTNSNWSACTLYYTKQDETGEWSIPDKAYFQNGTDGWLPFFSNDNKFFFSSENPANIWQCTKSGSGWSEPVRLDSPINTSSREWYANTTNDGTLYFTSNRPGGNGDYDIYKSELIDGKYLTVENLGSPINSPYTDASPKISSDEKFLIFESMRPGGYGNADLYISYKNDNGSWSEPQNLGPNFNTNQIDDGGYISPDGKYFFFNRREDWITNKSTDIYWVDIRAVIPDPNGPIENLSSGLRFGSIQCAVNYAQPGDIVEIKPGLYQEPVTIDKDIIVRSLDPNDPFYVGGTIINGDLQNSALTLTGNTAACEITGLTIRAGSVGITGTATSATIRNCRIIDNAIHGIELFELSSPTLKNCLITANGQTGIMMHDAMSRGNPPCEPVIENCIIVDNGNVAIDGGEPVIVDSIIE